MEICKRLLNTELAVWLFLVIPLFTEYQVIYRAPKGKGFDYWLGKKDEATLFQNKVRLEVSGILKGNESDIKKRTNQKLKQTKRSDSSMLKAYAVIVEFSEPSSHISKRSAFGN